MFELIGIAFVAWISWSIIKAIVAIAAKNTLQNAMSYAARYGAVPHEFSRQLIDQPELLKTARRMSAKEDRAFGALDVYEQYGKVIMRFYAGKGRVDRLNHAKEEIREFLAPQIAELESEGIGISVSHIALAYVCTLAMAMTKHEINLEETKDIVRHCFEGKHHAIDGLMEWQITLSSTDFSENVIALIPTAEREVAAGKGDYFVRLTRHSNAEKKKMYEPGSGKAWDPRTATVNPTWFLEV